MVGSKIRVAFVSIFYPLFMGRYIWEALLRREDLEVWAAGPYTASWIPWKGGMRLPPEYVREPDFGISMLPHEKPYVDYHLLTKEAPWAPDLWIEVNAGLNVNGRPDAKYAIIGTDPHVLDYTMPRFRSDFFFCMQGPYMQSGDIWLPYGYDPIWHSPSEIPWKERKYDASLIGLQYPNRAKLFQRLKIDGRQTFFDTGPSYFDARDIYHDSRVGVNWSSLQDTTARVFELMALGVVPVLNRVPDLMSMFEENVHFLGFSTHEEALQKIDRALSDPEASKMIVACNGVTIHNHSWDMRIKRILEAISV